ncbi:cytochrome P450 306a1-like [Zophobas morio]|uniref:cytochrome P450 306a1-like n=1 Tax=Zophobas morio TaxID=2755281 RepID=UPI003082FB43
MLTTLLVTIITFLFFLYKFYNQRKEPPGPWNLPLIGYLHKLDPKFPNLSLTELAKKYGPIYSIKLGLENAVVISDAKLLKKVLMNDNTLHRSRLYLFNILFSDKGIVCCPLNVWIEKRKLVNNFLRTCVSKGSPNKETLEDQIRKSAEEFINYVRNQRNLNPLEAAAHYVISTTSSLILGTSFTLEDKIRQTIIKNIQSAMRLGRLGGPLNFFPILRFLPKYKIIADSFKRFNGEVLQIIKDINKSTINDNWIPNLRQTFWHQSTKCNCPEIYTTEHLEHLLFEIFGASTETTLTSLLWIMLYLARYQQVQDKVRQELRDVLGTKAPQIEDSLKLPYTQATISEVARIRTVVPLGLPHYASEDINVDHFIIRKSSVIIPLLWRVHMDPKFWKNPQDFRPDRFLNEEGKFCRSESLIPFQIGKRMCVGKDLAKMVIFLFVATVLQKVKIECSEGVDLSYTFGFTLQSNPQELTFTTV